ncbi:MAG TPA: LuxR C-terminal-related transcriptional regulator [Caulobacteraceae bacterium]|nr:LuxR C-terminal-related transcriptional regulator [Caulobacteraceae bacterium]
MTFAPFRRRVVHERRVGSWSIMVPRWRGPDVLDIDDFSQAVARIYDASVSVERWDDALKFLAGLFDSQKAQISYYTSVHDHSPFVRLWGSRVEDFERAFRTYIDMTASDPRAPPRSFKAYHCRQIVSDETLWSSPMYRQALAPAGIEYAMYFTLDLEEATCAAGVMRGPGQAPYTVDDCNDFGRFIPHISRAVMMFGTLRRARGAVEAAQALIDGVPLGMIVAREGEMLLANTTARSMLAQGDAVRWAAGRLQATAPRADAGLRHAVGQARDGRDTPVGLTLAVGEAGQVQVVVRRLQTAAAGLLGASEGAIAIYLADSRRPMETSEEVLRRLFGLTEREATVLAALIGGDDARAIARRLSIGPETVKTHLRHIMQAVGVGRQAELIKLVLSSPAWIGGGGRTG